MMNSLLPQNTDNVMHFRQFGELRNRACVIRERYRYSTSLLAVNTSSIQIQANYN